MKRKVIGLLCLVILVIFAVAIKNRSANEHVAADEKDVVSTVKNLGKSDDDLKAEQESYLKTVYNQADSLIASENFDGAIRLYQTAYEKYPSVEELNDRMVDAEKMKEAYMDVMIAEKESEAKSKMDVKDYNGAVASYTELYNMTENDSYKVLIQSIEETLSDEAIEEAYALAKSGDYSEAMACLDSAESSVSSKNALEEARKEIEKSRPVSLLDFEIFQANVKDMGASEMDIDSRPSDVTLYVYDEYKVNTGQSHSGIECTGSEGEISYYLDGEYDRFQAEYCLSAMDKDTDHVSVLQVFSDDTLIYTTEEITGGSLPVKVDVDISGCKILKLKFKSGYDSNLFYVYYISTFISEPVVIKELAN